ncbi:MAG: hypothetical protein LW875_03600 [Proteobacteria bacterium]|jgi:hypothetical protein|nr:hypothetical protein [Pseudomonadota bacterium]
MKKMGLFLAITLMAVQSFGQNSGMQERRLRSVEDQVSNLQRVVEGQQFQIENLNRRLERLEFGGGPINPRENVSVCMLVASSFLKTYLGTGKNKMDAEYSARESCQKGVHSSFCRSGALKCDSNLDTAFESEAVCLVTAATYGRTYRGEGRTAIEAEAKAKQACQEDVHASYCGNVKARCEVTPKAIDGDIYRRVR